MRTIFSAALHAPDLGTGADRACRRSWDQYIAAWMAASVVRAGVDAYITARSLGLGRRIQDAWQGKGEDDGKKFLSHTVTFNLRHS